ncbi:MAG TPA: bifunctional glutamate N-acetyltransferase/amino-acid acetyltransferase ArgJ [Clostridiaceae bacterium]|jgi:glutamate N-acetyltransferase/amino-acid N-acetyltransferase|nr:bifunctional glutamate N-acetyltransferase/amino-acid acetyltransferase ArgJ [Clostridiaceae bacterium]
MVTFARGFKASGVACGLKKNGRKDLAVVISDSPCVCAGVYTTNIVKGHSLQLTMERMETSPYVNAVVVNSGCANACVGQRGYDDAQLITEYLAQKLNVDKETVLIGSTGVIGVPLNVELIRKGIDKAFDELSYIGGHDAMEAIMTTDTVPKLYEKETVIGGKTVRIGGMAKGSGMIHPNMATMISIITTDANISKKMLDKALSNVVNKTFNRVSVDGDTSVCDMCLVMASQMAGNECIEEDGSEYILFEQALYEVCLNLAKAIAKDGEGATKLVEIEVVNAKSKEDADLITSAIAKSPLCKTAFFGEDANWGRIITAAGYSKAYFEPNRIDIYIGGLAVCKNGVALEFDEDIAIGILKQDEFKILVDLNLGSEKSIMWTCDFSYDYVKINGSYRS